MYSLFVSYMDDSTREPIYDLLTLAFKDFCECLDNPDVYSVSISFERD